MGPQKPPVKPGEKPKPPVPETPKKEDPPPKKEEKKAETGLINRKNPSGSHSYWIYVPRDYDPNVGYALVLWLHPVGKSKDQDIDDFLDAWISYCRENHIILAGPIAENTTGWVASEADVVAEVAQDVLSNYTIDRRRVVVHGMGVGGQMAFYLGFHNRDLVRAVAATGAGLTSTPKEKVANQPLAFFLHAGAKDPLARAVADSRDKLIEHKFPVVFREVADMGHQYLDEKTLEELVRWIDSLDRL
jgi:pimeloyl-ACP methyl ester carboxylesterase